jgi:hypothetical protein
MDDDHDWLKADNEPEAHIFFLAEIRSNPAELLLSHVIVAEMIATGMTEGASVFLIDGSEYLVSYQQISSDVISIHVHERGVIDALFAQPKRRELPQGFSQMLSDG